VLGTPENVPGTGSFGYRSTAGQLCLRSRETVVCQFQTPHYYRKASFFCSHHANAAKPCNGPAHKSGALPPVSLKTATSNLSPSISSETETLSDRRTIGHGLVACDRTAMHKIPTQAASENALDPEKRSRKVDNSQHTLISICTRLLLIETRGRKLVFVGPDIRPSAITSKKPRTNELALGENSSFMLRWRSPFILLCYCS